MRIAGIATVLVVALATLVGVSDTVAPTSPASAASGADFQAGFIVSDANFYDGGAMSASQVQSFLLSQNSRCNSSYACLYGYGQNTPNMPGDSYCSPMSGQASELASSMIARVGAACNISQKALIVLLQKEQGLVTSSSPTQSAFLHATGFSCPDTAPCDPNYAGFFYQLYYGARQFQIYRQHPTWYNYQPNAWNSILYNPNTACGRSSVYIQGYATAGLYNYTPYQPNAAALNNMYGTGDSCSAYGNRNFWRYWSDWFGSPTVSSNLIRVNGTVYLTSGNQAYPFTSSEMLAQYTALGTIQDVSQSAFNYFQTSVPVQRALRTPDGTMYLIDANRRYRFRDCAQVNNFGQVCDRIPTISFTQLNAIPDGGYLTDLVKLSDNSIWLMQGGQRRQTPDPTVLAPYGIPSATTSLSNFSIGSAQIGAPVIGAGVFTDGQGSYIASTYGGVFTMSAAAATGGVAAQAVPLQIYSFQRVSTSGSLPLRMSSSGRYFVAIDGGWLEVDGPTFGGDGVFTSAPANAWTGVPLVDSQFGALFARERSSSQIYLISGGSKQMVPDQATVDWISQTYGVPPTIRVAADGALRGLAPAEGVFLNLAGTQTNYLLDGGKKYLFRDCAQLSAWGKTCGQLPSFSSSQLSEYPTATTLTDLIKQPDGSIWLIQSGTRRETPDPSVLTQYFIPTTTTTLSTAALGRVPIGVPVTRAGLYTDGGGVNWATVTLNGNYQFSSGPWTNNPTKLQPPSFQKLGATQGLPTRMVSDGRYFIPVKEGWLEVAPATFGGTQMFSSAPTKAWTGLPLAGTVTAPFFVSFATSPQSIYLVSGGQAQPVADQASATWLAGYYGLSPRIWVATGDILAGFPGRG